MRRRISSTSAPSNERLLVSNHSLEERKVSAANDGVRSMDAWTIILMLGATVIWTSLVVGVVYATRAHRAADLRGGGSTSAHR
jgi:hypothetical protein